LIAIEIKKLQETEKSQIIYIKSNQPIPNRFNIHSQYIMKNSLKFRNSTFESHKSITNPTFGPYYLAHGKNLPQGISQQSLTNRHETCLLI
jgi:hypothetical protein